ncbi:MAG: FAD-dependent oxidoreductase, partial [bacterium]
MAQRAHRGARGARGDRRGPRRAPHAVGPLGASDEPVSWLAQLAANAAVRRPVRTVRDAREDGLYDVVVVGAGVAGLACAGALRESGASVVVLEKSRGVGGRCATRR